MHYLLRLCPDNDGSTYSASPHLNWLGLPHPHRPLPSSIMPGMIGGHAPWPNLHYVGPVYAAAYAGFRREGGSVKIKYYFSCMQLSLEQIKNYTT